MAIKLYQSQPWLFNQYIVNGKTVNEIAKMCGVSANTIDRYIKKFGLQRNRRSWNNG